MLKQKKSLNSVVLISNIPVPYREKLYEKVSELLNGRFTVLYMSKIEPDRTWKFEFGKYKKIFLKSKAIKYLGFYTQLNISAPLYLLKSRPTTVILTSFASSNLMSFVIAKIIGSRLIYFTDGSLRSERNLTFIHKVIRRLLIPRFDAGITISSGGERLLKFYNMAPNKIFRTCIPVVDELYYSGASTKDARDIDLLFCGQFIDRKNPWFFVKLVERLSQNRKELCSLMIGDGPLFDEIVQYANAKGLNITFQRSVAPNQIHTFYERSKIFCFPTKMDAWGVVVGEAMAGNCIVVSSRESEAARTFQVLDKYVEVISMDFDLWVHRLMLRLERYCTPKHRNLPFELSSDSCAKGFLHSIEYTKT